ncbi:hypothetical protein Zm00014a_001663 [Zea mays]|uniref:Uncharacterized protein n=1 Tax=Zea mays TaxID=4577 RepID=A0A317Y1I8_MAIZE|nr:hypothetical protein Zm00014a_001663 [Zea mays]
MCRALMPGDEESMSDEAIWETLPDQCYKEMGISMKILAIESKQCGGVARHLAFYVARRSPRACIFPDMFGFLFDILFQLQHFWVAISMVFLIAATTFTLLKLSGDVGALGWWDLFINYGIAECFAFLVCTRWFNPMIHKSPTHGEASSSSAAIRYRDWESGLVLPSLEDHEQEKLCGLPDIGGHVMKIPLVAFQVLLCMRLEPHQKFAIALLFFIMVQGFLVGGLLMKGARKNKPGYFILNLLGTIPFVAIRQRWLGKCLKRTLQKRFGGYRQLWENNLKSPSVPNRNMKGFKM